jgi:hypothetical protein
MLRVDSSLACVLFDHDSLVFILAHSGGSTPRIRFEPRF